MASRRSKIVLLLLLALVGVGGVIFVRETLLKPAPIQAILSDGLHRVELLQGGVGSVSYSSDSLIKGYLRKTLPQWIISRFDPVTSYSASGAINQDGAPVLMLLFRLTDLAGKPVQDLGHGGRDFHSRIELDGSDGHVFRIPREGYSSSGELVILRVPSFPRRERKLKVRIYERETDKKLLEFTVPNASASQSFPTGQPESLPAMKTSEPVTVTVSDVSVDAKTGYATAQTSVTVSDPAWQNHEMSYRFVDATGNQGPALSFLEPWKAIITVRRNQNAVFHAHEVWELPPVPLQQVGQFHELKLSKTVDGLPLSVPYLAGAGRIIKEEGVIRSEPPASPDSMGAGTFSGTEFQAGRTIRYSGVESGRPFFLLESQQTPTDVRLLFKIIDQDGHELKIHGGGTTYTSGGLQTQVIQFTPEATTQTVMLRIMASRARTLEFLVRPPATEQN